MLLRSFGNVGLFTIPGGAAIGRSLAVVCQQKMKAKPTGAVF
jgi:hypothetical protein